MKFSIVPFIGRIYVLFCTICVTLISILIIYQCYNSKLFNDSTVLKIVLPIAITTGLFSLILPTQVPLKLGVAPDAITQKYLDKIAGKKLTYRIAPNDKIEVYEIPKLIWRQKIVYIGIALLTTNQSTLENIIINAIKTQPGNLVTRELKFWQGVESVTSNNFQLWKPFTRWYIKHLLKLIDNYNCSYENCTFNDYIIDKTKKKEFNIFVNYVSSRKEFTNVAKDLDKACTRIWVAAHALLTSSELTVDEVNLPKYQDICQLASLGIIDVNLSPQKVSNGLNERLDNSYETKSVELNNAQRIRIYNHITKNCPHVDIVEITKRKLQWVPEIPSFVITCRQHKCLLDFNERTHLIQKQLQMSANSLDGDWTIVVINK